MYTFLVKHAVNGGKGLGIFTKPLLQFAKFPETIYNVFQEIKKPERLNTEDPNFKPVNELDYNIYGLNGQFEVTKWVISLRNLRTDSVLHEWVLKESFFKKTNREFSHAEPRDPILLQDKSVIFTCDESFNLFRLDKESKIIWHNTDFQYHHSINEAQDGNIWACSRKLTYSMEPANNAVKYWDNFLVKVDVKTGETILNKSVSQLLTENGYSYIIHGMGNQVLPSGNDPLHLNEIEPVLSDSPYWKTGDLFLSFRNRSLIILYRPETNKILRLIQGPFLSQHDVDIVSESKISLFNNNVSNFAKQDTSGAKMEDYNPGTRYSGIVIYNFEDSTFTPLMDNQFQAEKIFTLTQGTHTILKNGDVFVESQNQGKVYIFNEKRILLKKYYNKPVNNFVEPPHWVRIYEDIPF
jgi:hypothetical protein